MGSPDYRRVSVQLIGFGISGSRYFWFNEPELRFVYKTHVFQALKTYSGHNIVSLLAEEKGSKKKSICTREYL